MAVRILQQIGGSELQLSQDAILIIALVLLLIGVLLAFAGARIWKSVMSFIGSILFSILGFTIGTAVGGTLMGYIVAGLAAIIGGVLFVFLARVAIGLVAGLLFFVLGAGLTGSAVIGLVAGVVGFVVAFVYIDRTLGIVTAVLGGILVGLGLYLLDFEMIVVLLSMLATMAFGATVQMMFISEKSRPMEPVPPPPPPD